MGSAGRPVETSATAHWYGHDLVVPARRRQSAGSPTAARELAEQIGRPGDDSVVSGLPSLAASRRSWVAVAIIRSITSAARGMSWINPAVSPAMTAAVSKSPAAPAAAYRGASASMARIRSGSRPAQHCQCSLTRHLPVKGAGQTLRREMSNTTLRRLSSPLASTMRCLGAGCGVRAAEAQPSVVTRAGMLRAQLAAQVGGGRGVGAKTGFHVQALMKTPDTRLNVKTPSGYRHGT